MGLDSSRPTDPGTENSLKTQKLWKREWNRLSIMAVGRHDRILNEKSMGALIKVIRGCLEPKIYDVGHFVQERGNQVARDALEHFVFKV